MRERERPDLGDLRKAAKKVQLDLRRRLDVEDARALLIPTHVTPIVKLFDVVLIAAGSTATWTVVVAATATANVTAAAAAMARAVGDAEELREQRGASRLVTSWSAPSRSSPTIGHESLERIEHDGAVGEWRIPPISPPWCRQQVRAVPGILLELAELLDDLPVVVDPGRNVDFLRGGRLR